MKIVARQEHFLVIDDFLSEGEFSNLIKFVQQENFKFIQIGHFNKVYRLSDGNPIEGRVVLSTPTISDKIPDVFSYPSDTAMDALIKKIDNCTEKDSIVGKKDKDWKYFSAKPLVYPVNSGISWHTDHRDVTGAYTFYCHPFWDVHWSGEILLSSVHVSKLGSLEKKDTEANSSIYQKSIFDDSIVNHVLQHEDGFGTYIIPKPNRIVFLKSGYFHKVQKVSPEAGDKNRSTIVGFFIKSNFVDRMD